MRAQGHLVRELKAQGRDAEAQEVMDSTTQKMQGRRQVKDQVENLGRGKGAGRGR